jgi:hypothetical protein
MAASLLDGLYQEVSESTTRIKKELFANDRRAEVFFR